MTRFLSAAWAWLGANHEQVKIVFVVVAGLYVLFEYRVQVQADRVKHAVEYVEKYDESKSSGGMARLDALWLSSDVRDLRERMKKEPAVTRADQFHRQFAELVQNHNLIADVYRMLTHFRKVAICAESGLCNADTLCRFMFDDIQSFRETYRGLLEQEFKADSNGEVARFAENTCKQQFGTYCRQVPASPYCRRH
jgi:hypothetical protein